MDFSSTNVGRDSLRGKQCWLFRKALRWTSRLFESSTDHYLVFYDGFNLRGHDLRAHEVLEIFANNFCSFFSILFTIYIKRYSSVKDTNCLNCSQKCQIYTIFWQFLPGLSNNITRRHDLQGILMTCSVSNCGALAPEWHFGNLLWSQKFSHFRSF